MSSDVGEAVIFDIDGTLALIDHRRHHVESKPTDWDAFFGTMDKDEPNIPVINTLRGLMAGGYIGLICSGRPEDYRDVTEVWLRHHSILYQRLYMRPSGDFRSDVDVKREMLAQIREEGYQPVLACDDRTRLVDMWREEGLVCLQAAPGDF